MSAQRGDRLALTRFIENSQGDVWRYCAYLTDQQTRRRNLLQRLRDNSSENSVAPIRDIELTQLIGSLDPDRRDAFVLTQILGLSYDEAAEICGCPVGTIRSRVARARTDAVNLLNQASGAAEA